VENPRQELVELRAEVRRLQRENLEFRQQVGYLEELSSRCPAPHRRVRVIDEFNRERGTPSVMPEENDLT